MDLETSRLTSHITCMYVVPTIYGKIQTTPPTRHKTVGPAAIYVHPSYEIHPSLAVSAW
jgi:hypothetical protein